MAADHALAEAVVLRHQDRKPLLARGGGGQQRHAVSHTVAHVQHVSELMDDDVVRPVAAFATAVNIGPGQHHRAAFHGFAGDHFVVVVDDAVFVRDYATRHHL